MDGQKTKHELTLDQALDVFQEADIESLLCDSTLWISDERRKKLIHILLNPMDTGYTSSDLEKANKIIQQHGNLF